MPIEVIGTSGINSINDITISTGGTPRMVIKADGTSTTSSNPLIAPVISTIAPIGFKNRIINGNFDVWQRGTSFGGNFTNLYGADRWAQGQFQGGPQSRQLVTSGLGPVSRYCARISSSSTASISVGSRMALGQKVESLNCYDLRGQQVTLSFWVRFSAATFSSVANSTDSSYGGFNFGIWDYSSTTDAVFSSTAPTGTSFGTVSNGSLPTVWTKYTITRTISATANNVAVRFNMSALGSTAADGSLWYEVTDVQLERGAVATSFDPVPFGLNLFLCQRYYEKSYSYETLPGALGSWASTHTVSFPKSASTFFDVRGLFQVQKLKAPTMTYYNPATGATNTGRAEQVAINNVDFSYTLSTIYNTTYGYMGRFVATVNPGGLADGQTYMTYNYTAEAEL